VRAAESLEDLLASPNERYLVGPISLSFVIDPRVVGTHVWGRPTTEQIMALVDAHERMRPVLSSRTCALVDLRRLEWPDPAAFDALVRYFVARREWLGEYIERVALVRSIGPMGAATEGFFDLTPQVFRVQTFGAVEDALAWFGRSNARAIAEELASLLEQASNTPDLLRRLRERLDASPRSLSVDEAARALGVGDRTLQRTLTAARTSFVEERRRAQVRKAQSMLREQDASLAEIAHAVGCASLSHFGALFRKATGMTPSAWRARHRAPKRA
jgi:AraC-like DNA-binding protein